MGKKITKPSIYCQFFFYVVHVFHYCCSKLYIKRILYNLERQVKTEYIINLTDIDATEWRDVRTSPYRALRDEVKNIAQGIGFIEDFLKNGKNYIVLD